jgi:hypothetical protein
MLGVPIHGRGIFQRSNRISNLKGCMRRMPAGKEGTVPVNMTIVENSFQ